MDLLLDVQGTGSFAQTNQMQRVWRDMHMASRHGMSVPGLKEELYGRALLGANEQQMTPIIWILGEPRPDNRAAGRKIPLGHTSDPARLNP